MEKAIRLMTFIALTETAMAGSIADDLQRAVQIEAVQPSAALIEKIEHQPDPSAPNVRRLNTFTDTELPYRPDTVLMENNIPYYPYYALKDGSSHVLHPMALGRFLLKNASGTMAQAITEAAVSVAHVLPNDGLAWYYPKHYRVARMLGKELKFSSISQGTIIAGLVGLAKANNHIDARLARRAFLAMEWPFEKGGINLAGRAVLEMPSFSGPPEIILNGWIDALLHIRDYAEAVDDKEAMQFFQKNVEFLTEILPNFNAPEAKISRYSDLSPYRVKIRLADSKDVDSLRVLYRPKHSALEPILVPLKRTADSNNFSIYDNQILRQNGREATVWLSCSQLYETVILANSKSMMVELSKGSIERRQSTPGFAGDSLNLPGEPVDGSTQSASLSSDTGLICGYPTNFSKGGTTNYYHVYHVVGLMLLALGEGVEIPQKRILIEWALKWYDDMQQIQRDEGLPFEPFEDMLTATTANQYRVVYSSFDQLLRDARRILQ
jgi:hypothetical protein